MKWTRADRKWGRFVVRWTATRICAIEDRGTHVYATGPEGRVAILTPTGSQEEMIDPSPQGPLGRGPIRDLRKIGNQLYACGMARQVYHRAATGWTRQDQGVVLPLGATKIAGFNSLDGLNEGDIYAVGYGGEIWRRVGGNWQQIVSPTNVILNRVKVVGPDRVFACGQKGVLLAGSSNQWRQIDHDATTDQLWGMDWFNNALYVSSEDALYRFDGAETLEPVNVKLGKGWTFGHLHSHDGVLWSFGTKHLAWTEDGVHWNDGFPR